MINYKKLKQFKLKYPEVINDGTIDIHLMANHIKYLKIYDEVLNTNALEIFIKDFIDLDNYRKEKLERLLKNNT